MFSSLTQYLPLIGIIVVVVASTLALITFRYWKLNSESSKTTIDLLKDLAEAQQQVIDKGLAPKRLCIALVEDHANLAEMMRQKLEDEYDIRVFSDKRTATFDALEAISEGYRRSEPFDLVITDYAMPLSGGALVRMVRIMESETSWIHSRIKFAIITGWTESVPTKLEVEAVWCKPQDIYDLPILVKELLSKK